jgi:signal transduction histidine kinase/CheY-like chemotaxis protein
MNPSVLGRAPSDKERMDPSLIAIEKLQSMRDYSKSSTIATILAPLLCIPLYWDNTDPFAFGTWFVAMSLAVMARYGLIRSIGAVPQPAQDAQRLNIGIGLVTFVWGMGWYVFVQPSDMVSYLMYQIISLTVLFVGMVGYCINWRTFFAFVIPLKAPELLFIGLHFSQIVWPIALGSMVAFYLALKMAFLFSKSWEKSFALRLKNDALIDQLIEEKNASMAANLAKSEFIATASHDLRQPMQSINIFMDMIDTRQLSEGDGSIFGRMKKSVTVLNRMFNTLLDISKLDSNFDVRQSEFHLVEVIHNLEEGFADLHTEKNIKLTFKGGRYMVLGDPHLLEQILRNLLANAIQYTDRGHIQVVFEANSDGLSFSVEDTGCGIPQADLPLIFNEFFRSDHSRSQYDGLGLGLAIVNRIVKKIKGQCQVQSVVGKGSVFTVHTPFAIVARQALDHSRADPAHTLGKDADTPEMDSLEADSTRHLGIIENDEALVQAYQQYFTQAGYSVHIVPYEEAAFMTYLATLPKLDFILSDFRLGAKNGIYFIQKLREEFNHDIPACIVTADTSPQHLELFNQHNIDVMYKPIDIKTIEKSIAHQMP